MDQYYFIYQFINSSDFLRTIFAILSSIILAKVVDIIFTIIFKRIVSRTQTSLDDQILQLLHKPVFFTILFLGFSIAIKTAKLSEELDFAFVGVLKTITTIIWLFVSIKILVLSMEWISRQRVSSFLQKNIFVSI